MRGLRRCGGAAVGAMVMPVPAAAVWRCEAPTTYPCDGGPVTASVHAPQKQLTMRTVLAASAGEGEAMRRVVLRGDKEPTGSRACPERGIRDSARSTNRRIRVTSRGSRRA